MTWMGWLTNCHRLDLPLLKFAELQEHLAYRLEYCTTGRSYTSRVMEFEMLKWYFAPDQDTVYVDPSLKQASTIAGIGMPVDERNWYGLHPFPASD